MAQTFAFFALLFSLTLLLPIAIAETEKVDQEVDVKNVTGNIDRNASTTALQTVASAEGGSSSSSSSSSGGGGIVATLDTAAEWFNKIDKGSTPIKILMDMACFTKPILMVVDTLSFFTCMWRFKYGLGGGMGLRGYLDFFMCGTTAFRMMPFVGEIVQLGIDQAYMSLMDGAGYPAVYSNATESSNVTGSHTTVTQTESQTVNLTGSVDVAVSHNASMRKLDDDMFFILGSRTG